MNNLVKPLEWSENLPGDETTSYDHCFARTPIGRFRITWKGWKESPSYDIDETPWGEFGGEGSDLEEAKRFCSILYYEKINECLI